MAERRWVLAVLMAAYADHRTANVLNLRPPRFFVIDPQNHSGKRLYRVTDGWHLRVTNACPQWGTDPSHRGRTCLDSLERSIYAREWDALLVCGKQAHAAVDQLLERDPQFRYEYGDRIVRMKHPADRTLSNVDMDTAATQLNAIGATQWNDE